jgi:uncharacterized membrane protein YfcA
MPLASLPPEFALLAVGAAAGLIGGLFGVGGGILMIPGMVIFLGNQYGPNSLHLYKLAAITTSIVLSTLAAIRHARAGAVVYRLLPGIIPPAIVGVVAGVLFANLFVDERTAQLRRLFGAFLLLVVAVNLWQEWRAIKGRQHLRNRSPMPHRWLSIGLIVGLPAGFIAGLLGVGGGVWAVPSQRQLLGIRMRNAIANSSLLIVGIAACTSATLGLALTQIEGVHPSSGWYLALWLAPGAVLGGWIGAGMTHKLPAVGLRYGFQVLLIVTGLRLLAATSPGR